MPTMKVNWYYADTHWEDEENPEPKWTIIGVLLGDWRDGMSDTYLDSRTIYWFDTDAEVLALKKGHSFGDGLVIDSIDYTPDYREEEYELSEYDLLENADA
jgi:hypothetical protein